MKTEAEITKNAYLACRNALAQELPGATNHDFIGIMALMVHILLTENGSLGLGASLHNCEVFHQGLKSIITETQADIKGGSASMVM